MEPSVTPKRWYQQKWFILTGLAIGVVILGIIVATQIELVDSLRFQMSGDRPLTITEITLGMLADPTQRDEPLPRLRQRSGSVYFTTDPLALRLTTDPSVTQSYTIGVRLITDTGEIVDLNPSYVTLPPGTGGYCCWTVEREGTYLLQIFRPERTITSLPLTIRAAPAGGSRSTIFNF